MADTGLPGAFSVRRPGWSDIKGWANYLQYMSIQTGDIDGDGQAELIGRGNTPPGSGVYGGTQGPGPLSANHFDTTYGQWNALPDGPVLPDPGILADMLLLAPGGPFVYGRDAHTFLLGDIDANQRAELVVICGDGIAVFGYDPPSQTWAPLPNAPLPNGPNLGWFGLLAPHGNYLTLALVDIDGDGQQELAGLGNAANGPLEFWHCDKSTYAWTQMPPLILPATTNWSIPIPPGNTAPDAYYGTIRYGVLNNQQHVFVRASDGVYIYSYNAQTSAWNIPSAMNGPPLADSDHWNNPAYFRTFQVADINGDGNVEIVVRASMGIQIWTYSSSDGSWTLSWGPLLTDSDGWGRPEYYMTIQYADINGDGRAEILGRSSIGLYSFFYDPTTGAWSGGPLIADLTDQAGWNQPQYYMTIQCADVDGDGCAEIVARAADGVYTYRYQQASGSFTSASATFPPFSGDQLTAYQQISAQLMAGEAGADLRSLYPKGSNYSWNEAQDQLTIWAGSSANGVAWQTVSQQLLNEVNALQQVIVLFANYETVFLQDAFVKSSLLTEIGGMISSSYSNPDSSSSVDYGGMSNILNICWALSGLIENAPGVGVISGLLESAVGFASTFAGGNAVSTNPVSATFAQMGNDLINSFMSGNTANGTNQTAVLSDYGLLMNVGHWAEQGPWAAASSDQVAAQSMAARAYAFYIFQTLTPLVWCIYLEGSFSQNPQPPCGYPSSWTVSGNAMIPIAGAWIWPYYIASINVNNEDTDCLDQSTLGSLFNPVSGSDPTPLGVAPSDVLKSLNGWRLRTVKQNYNPG